MSTETKCRVCGESVEGPHKMSCRPQNRSDAERHEKQAHEMNEGVVRWAAQRAKAALEALGAHDRQTREMLDRAKGGEMMAAGAFDGRSDARIDLAAQVAETSRVLVNAVLG